MAWATARRRLCWSVSANRFMRHGNLFVISWPSGAGKGTLVVYCLDTDEVLKNVKLYLGDGDTVLVKASHGMAFQKIVDELK